MATHIESFYDLCGAGFINKVVVSATEVTYTITADFNLVNITDGVEISSLAAETRELIVDTGVTFTIHPLAALYVSSGNTLTNNGTLIISDNSGSITNSGTITNDGIIISKSGTGTAGTIVDTGGTFTNNSLSLLKTIDNFTFSGNQLLDIDFTIASGETFTIGSGQTLTINSGKTLSNEGIIFLPSDGNGLTTTGTFTNSGVVINKNGNAYTLNTNYTSQILNNDLTIESNGYLYVETGQTLTVSSGKGIQFNSNTSNRNNGIIILGNGGGTADFTKSGTATMINNGIILEKPVNDYTLNTLFRSQHTILSSRTLTIAANETLTIGSGETLTINSGGTLTNSGIITNNGTITNNIGTSTNNIVNNGTITNNSSGIITNTGGSGGNGIYSEKIITNSGTINNSNTGIGFGIHLKYTDSVLTNNNAINNTSSVTAIKLETNSLLINGSTGTITNNHVANIIIIINSNALLDNTGGGTITNNDKILADGGTLANIVVLTAPTSLSSAVQNLITNLDVTTNKTIENNEEIYEPDLTGIVLTNDSEKRFALSKIMRSINNSKTDQNNKAIVKLSAIKSALPSKINITSKKIEITSSDTTISKTEKNAYYILTNENTPLKITTKNGKILVVTQTSSTEYKINKYGNDDLYNSSTNPNSDSKTKEPGFTENYDGFQYLLGSILGENQKNTKRRKNQLIQSLTGFNLNSEVYLDQGSYSISKLLSKYSQIYNFSYNDFSSSLNNALSIVDEANKDEEVLLTINGKQVLGVISTKLYLDTNFLSYNLILDSNKGENIQVLSDSSVTYFNSISKTHPISQIYLNVVINKELSIKEKINQIEGMINYYSNNIQVLLFIERMLGRYLVYRPTGYLPSTSIFLKEI